MAKKVLKQLKLIIPGGKAVPGQALGPALGQAGINIGEFVKRFNDETKTRVGEMVPTIIEVFDDRTYKMTYKTEPASGMILKAIKAERPDLRLHGFGIKTTALSWEEVRDNLESADSMAWSFAARMEKKTVTIGEKL
jgi:ribosomal protein L11